MKPDEEFMVNAVILASIHDEEISRRNPHTSELIYCNEPYTGQYFDRDEFLMRLWWYFDKSDSKKQTQLELALQNVRDESKTEQTTPPTRCGKIKAFFWKLYETTVKAFFDSLLGKSSPK